MGFVARVCQPSTLRMLICPEASIAQNNIAAVSADGRTVCVLIRRLNSSCKRSIAFVVRKLRIVGGHFAYFAVPTNIRALTAFRYQVIGLWQRWLGGAAKSTMGPGRAS